MPQGPGDDILDDIEGGSADDAVMSKYKINADQLKMFKGLHYGLSNEEMAYDEIKDYYPELESYFKRPAPLMPLQDKNQPQQITNPVLGAPDPEPDVFKLVQDKVRLGKELTASKDLSKSNQLYGGTSVLANDETTLNKRKTELATIDDQLKKAGYDPDDVTKSLGDLPNIPGFNAKEALQLKEENPLTFERKKAAIKSQYGLLHAIENKEGAKAANSFMHQYQALQSSQDYVSQRLATKAAIDAVHKYIDNTDDQDAIIRDMVRDKSFGYGVGLPGQEEAITNDPRSQSLNPYQVTALQFLEDVDPGKAQAYNRLTAFSPEELEQQEKNSSFARGYEAKSRDLENMGMNLMKNSLEEKMGTMLKTKDKWSEQDKQNYATIYERYSTLTEDYKNQNKRYPAMAVLDADRLMQDAMGSSTKGVVEKTVLGIGENVDDAINWVGDLIQSPFQTSKESALDDLQQLGDKRQAQLGQYETEGQELFNRQFKTVFEGDLKTKIDDIKSNASLADDEKRDAITGEIIKDNNQNVKYLPNDKAGKTNFTAKTVLNSVSNIVSEIVPQIALVYMTGGAGNASKLKELSSLFGSTFATAYNDIYNDAIEKDIPNPSQYALVHTTIEAGTELLFSDVARIKKLFSGKLTGKILEDVTEDSMKAITKTGRFAALGKTLQTTAKTAVKDAAEEAFEEISGQLAGNIADKKLFNQEVNVTDDVLQTGVSTFIGMLPLAGLGLPFRYKEISQMQKYALYEAAMNPDKFLAKVDEDVKNNVITSSEAEARKETITKAAKLVRAMNAVRSDGSVMTDNEKTEQLTNEVVTDAIKEQKKNAPEETKEQLIKIEETLDKEKEKLLKPEKNATKRKAKSEAKAETRNASDVAEVSTSNEQSQPAAIDNAGGSESAPVADLHYTSPEGTRYVLRGNDLYHVAEDGKETKFAKKSLQTPEAHEFIAKIKSQSSQSTPAPVSEKAPVADKGVQKADAGSTQTGVLHYTNPAGTNYVLRGDDLYQVSKNGKETKFAEKAMQTPETQKLIDKIKEANQNTEQSSGGQGAANEAAAEDVPINTEEDVVHELNRIMQSKAPGMEQAPAVTEAQVEGKTGKAKKPKKPNEPLAKLADQHEKVFAEDLGIDETDTAESVLDKLIAQDDEFTPLLKILRKMPILQKIKFEIFSPGKNQLLDQYLQENGLDPKRFAGLYFPKSKFIGTPHEALSNTLMLGNSSNVYYDLTHEFGHVLTIDNVGLWKKIMNASDRKLIEHIYKYIKDKKPKAEIEKHDQYGLATIEEFLVESIMNPAFRKYVSDVTAQSKDEFLSTAQKGEARDFILIIKEFFEDLIKRVLGKEQYAHGIENQPLIDKAVELATKLFLQGDAEVIKATEGGKAVSLDQYANVLPGGVLAMPAKKIITDKDDAIKALIKKTPASITDERLNELIVKATGITEDEAQTLIDEVRKPVVPIDQGPPLHHLSEEIKRSSLKIIDRVLEVPKSNEPTWLQRQTEAFKNGSAWIDNPYRFITKISEDINRTYKLSNNEQIPLGRQLEKTATGRAVLKIDSFIDEVVRGNIGGKKLGRLKGEKYKDFQRYLVAKRVEDRLYKQEEKQQAGENVSRQTGNVTRVSAEVTIQYLKNKYGDIDDFVARANALQQHMDTMLISLVGAGILSHESYDQIKADNDFYAPFNVVQSKLYAEQEKQSVGIDGVIKRIKGIDYKPLAAQQDKGNPFTLIDSLSVIDALGDALQEQIITPEEYFTTALQILSDAKDDGKISIAEYNRRVSELENPGFAIHDILDAAANMIYKAEGMALRNTMLQRLYAYKKYDTEGLFIQDVDGHQAMTLPDGSTKMVPKPLTSIKVEPGMAPIKLRVAGKDVIVAVDKRAARTITTMSNFEVSSALMVANAVNRVFRAIVITASPGFQVANVIIDFVRTTMFSRYGPLAGKGFVQPMVNFILYIPQHIEALLHSVAANAFGHKSKTYKQWMQSDSFSKGMFDNQIDNEKRIKEVNASTAKRVLMNFLKVKFIDVPGSVLEQTHKLAIHQRGMSVEGLKPEMVTALLASTFNRNINPNMTDAELKDAMDRLNYEVQNFAGSPNFQQTHRWMKLTSIFLQFFSARVKGEMTDYRRILNVFSGKSEGVKLTRQEAMQIGVGQIGTSLLMILAYAIKNNLDDDDEKEFNGVSPYRRDNSLNVPLGYFEYTDQDGNKSMLRDYAQIPLRGVTATMNVMANSYVKFYKRHNPDEFKKSALAFIANASPINLHGSDERELGESLFSNLTPIFKYFVEFSFNRDTHNHRNIIPDFVQGRGMLSKFRNHQIDPWDVATKKTPQWAKTMSKFLYDNLGIRVSAIELNHIEDNMGNPTELYDNAIKKRLFRSESQYPKYESPTENKNTSSATVTY